jgi:hypothetical protein
LAQRALQCKPLEVEARSRHHQFALSFCRWQLRAKVATHAKNPAVT